MTASNRAVFLDRDGTIIEEVGYLDRVDRIAMFPWTADVIRALNGADLRVIVVTNQAGVARGFFDEAVVSEVHAAIDARLESGGARVDAYYYCPHHPDGRVAAYRVECDCRKPASGMIERAVREFGIDPAASFVVGDRWGDVALARRVGARGVLVRTGYGAVAVGRPEEGLVADAVAANLAEAAGWILRQL